MRPLSLLVIDWSWNMDPRFKMLGEFHPLTLKPLWKGYIARRGLTILEGDSVLCDDTTDSTQLQSRAEECNSTAPSLRSSF